jgi:hypothetical protein
LEVTREEVPEAVGEIRAYEEGFTWKAVLGTFFVGIVIMPAAIYVGLVAGAAVGGAAQWMTIIVFSEVARRSFIPLKKQEIYILYYVAGGLAGMVGGLALAGGPFAWWIWNQYFANSSAAKQFGIYGRIPTWVVPPPGSSAVINRTFLDSAWLVPFYLLIAGQVISRLNWIGMGYFLFRVTSDTERLPFPLAPIAAAGATALAEVGRKEETWRWPVFSTGAVLGLIWGFFYVGIPAISSAFMVKPLQLIPIPYIDLTPTTESFLPSAPIGLVGNLGSLLWGFVLPFPIVLGNLIGSILCQVITNPIIYHLGYMPTWRPGMTIIWTQFATSFDVWISVGAGFAGAVAIIGFYSLGKVFAAARRQATGRGRGILAPPPGRGDFPLSLALAMWFIGTLASVIICHKLIPKFPLWILVLFAFLWTPLNSYISARMIGFGGFFPGIPYLREVTIILSGYKGVDIWFAPIPLADYGGTAQFFREVELTGTKFTSILKAEALMFFVILGFSFLYWQYIWKLRPIPDPAYPYAQRMWPLSAMNSALIMTANQNPEQAWLLKALKPKVIEASFGIGLLLYILINYFGLPPMFFYGFFGGIQAVPGDTLMVFIGALLGRYYFSKRFGEHRWRAYTPVLAAGYGCGFGLVSMICIALTLIAKSVSYMPY